MPLIEADAIPILAERFGARGVELFHACQLNDFHSYLALGGLPSRNLVTNRGLPLTEFDTDEVDRVNDVWDKVFLNLQDFGFFYAHGRRNENTAPTPNPYGPILLIFHPECLTECTDVAVCLRSAGAQGFDRLAEALGSVDEIDRMFEVAFDDIEGQYDGRRVRFKPGLQEQFPGYSVSSPEISCSVPGELISFENLRAILVDPYVINGISLVERVRQAKIAAGLGAPVWTRNNYIDNSRLDVLQELSEAIRLGDVTLDSLGDSNEISVDLLDYVTRLRNGNMGFEFGRFVTHLRDGTIAPLSPQNR